MRLLLGLLVSACIGVVATFAVSWLVLLKSPPLVEQPTPADPSLWYEAWPMPVPQGWPAQAVKSVHLGPRVRIESWHMVKSLREEGVVCTARRIEVGWPRPALAMTTLGEVDILKMRPPKLLDDDGWEPPRRLGLPSPKISGAFLLPVRLPVTPISTGFAHNAALFATGALVLLGVPRFVRRRVRRRRGRCVRCGYELKGLAVCPECGGAA